MTRKPCRILAFGSRSGWQATNKDPRAARRCSANLASWGYSGPFYWDGPRAAFRAARVMLARDATIQQIKIETISGAAVARLFSDGNAYAPEGRAA